MKEEIEDTMQIDSSSGAFKLPDIMDAIKRSNFNKGLGPDCFDGNVLLTSQLLSSKIAIEILDALNGGDIPEYLNTGRMVPLQKTATKGPVALNEIRPIVVRSHISKIMEKAILAKITETCPHLIDSKMYQTGFKDGKSTAIHISRLLQEIQGKKKKKYNLLIDLQKAYDSVDRRLLFRLMKRRCKTPAEVALVELIMKLH